MMPRRLNVQSTAWKEEELYLEIQSEKIGEISNWKDSERMLVDSDGLAFIYVLEDENGFLYIAIDKEHWNDIHKAMKKEASVSLQDESGDTVKLSALIHEMEFLTENIKGNANYGEMMEEEVEKIFGSEGTMR